MDQGLLVRMHAKRGKESAVEALLQSALATLNEAETTVASFVVRFGRREYGIFKVFRDDDAREAHLRGPAAALQARTAELFETAPALRKFEVLAEKLPVVSTNSDTKAVLLTFKPRAGHEQEVEDFLHYAKELVLNERNTTAWFALHAEDGAYGIFDVFPGHEDRFMHLVGHVPRELAKQAFSLLGSVPNLEMMNVHSERIGTNVLGTNVLGTNVH
jgi:quinol monooxygenase YgiN